MQAPCTQEAPAAQSPGVSQEVRQASGPQVNGAQLASWRSGQAPAPSQAAARVSTPPSQLAGRQVVAAPG
jgi:hypothetical protein